MSPSAHAVDPGRLARWCMEHLGSPPADEIFRSGYSTVSADELATVEDTERFLVAYCDARGREFSAGELERSWAAGVWTRAYDAKYQHAAGQPITSLSEHEARERLRRRGTASRRR